MKLSYSLCSNSFSSWANAYLGFPRLALMAGNSNFVKQTMQLVYYGVNLLGQVAGVHCSGRCALLLSSTLEKRC